MVVRAVVRKARASCAALALGFGLGCARAPHPNTDRPENAKQSHAQAAAKVPQLTKEQAAAIREDTFKLPAAEERAAWLEWALSDRSEELRIEALSQLAWAKDPAGVERCTASLNSPSKKVQGAAAMALAEYGPVLASSARSPLLAALISGQTEAEAQIAWALVMLGEARAVDNAIALYRQGDLSKVERLEGGSAFDVYLLASLLTPDRALRLAHDNSATLRELAAHALSINPKPEFSGTLLELLQDTEVSVSSAAAPGLVKLHEDLAHAALLAKLGSATEKNLPLYLGSLTEGAGAEGLTLALSAAPRGDSGANWRFKDRIFKLIHDSNDPAKGVNDPAGADALYAYIDKEPHIHFQTSAALALAAIGDVRAVPTLAKRLRLDPSKIYRDENDWEVILKHSDDEREAAARAIADLAFMHPDLRTSISAQAEDAVIFWIHADPTLEPNGARALAAMGSTKEVAALRKWSAPKRPLPKLGQPPPFFDDWPMAQTALRYLGMLEDEPSWNVMQNALKARPKSVDVTRDGMREGGKAMLGMAVRALGIGAAQGFSEWGDARAFRSLLEYVEDPLNNEYSRVEGCHALGWVAPAQGIEEILTRILQPSMGGKAGEFRRVCLLEALLQRPIPNVGARLMSLLTRDTAAEVRTQAARVIGKNVVDAELEKSLFLMMGDEMLRNDAALALVLGGSPATAARAVALFAGKPKESRDILATDWHQTFGSCSTADLESGFLFRAADNADAISQVVIGVTRQDWAKTALIRAFGELAFDNGPHSLTRAVFRHRLWQLAKTGDSTQRAHAIALLGLAKERGVLRALRDENGPWSAVAERAYFETTHTKTDADP